MILFKLITTCPNPHRHEAEVSHLSPGSIPDTANLLCQSFTFSPDHTPSQLLPIFPLGSCSSDPHRPLGFSASYRRYRCPHWLQHSGNECQSTRRQHRTQQARPPVYGRLCLQLLEEDDTGKAVHDPPRSQEAFQWSPSSTPD